MKRILPEHEFRAALQEERAFFTRGNHATCVVVFDVGETTRRGRDLRELGRGLERVLRQVEVAGWLDSKQIGVILRGADTVAGRRVAERLAQEVFPFAPEPSVGALRSAPMAPAPRSHAGRARGFGWADPARVHCDPAGLVGLLARPLPLWKRALDVVLAGAGLIVTAPLLLVIALAIKATSPGDVIYRQQRTGHGLRRFPIYKFRTMRTGSEQELAALARINEMSGPLFKSNADPRVTPIGRLLRRTSLDELPQLANVLRGDMTLLGPRALSPLPSAYAPWQLLRFTVTPGLACEWQALRRGETDFEAWMRSDLRYVDAGPSLLRDLALLARTAVAVLTCAGGR